MVQALENLDRRPAWNITTVHCLRDNLHKSDASVTNTSSLEVWPEIVKFPLSSPQSRGMAGEDETERFLELLRTGLSALRAPNYQRCVVSADPFPRVHPCFGTGPCSGKSVATIT